MTAVVRIPKPATTRALATAAVCVAAATMLGAATASPALLRFAIAAAILASLATVGVRAPRALMGATLAWLVVLGVLRRLLTASTAPTALDPLLLVGPAAALLLTVVAARNGAFKNVTRLSRAIFLLDVLLLISVVNPLQGGLLTGIAGLLFVLVPTLWFWVGRALVDDRVLGRILVLLGVLGLLSSVYGLRQTLVGFPSFDQAWIDAQGYEALRIGKAFRAFGPFVSASDYGLYLGMAFIAMAALVWRLRRTIPCLAALVIIGAALILASGRSVLVLVVVGLGVMVAAQRGIGPGRAALIGIGCFLALTWGISQVNPASFTDPRTSSLISHQVQGLSKPFDQNQSTLPGHFSLVTGGVTAAFSQPLGRGVGVITLAGSKFSGNTIGTEADPSNMGVALGICGLIAYCIIAFLAFKRAYRQAQSRRDALSVVVLGILVVTFLQWFAGGNYAMVPYPWLVLGWLDRPADDDDDEPIAVEAADVPSRP